MFQNMREKNDQKRLKRQKRSSKVRTSGCPRTRHVWWTSCGLTPPRRLQHVQRAMTGRAELALSTSGVTSRQVCVDSHGQVDLTARQQGLKLSPSTPTHHPPRALRVSLHGVTSAVTWSARARAKVALCVITTPPPLLPVRKFDSPDWKTTFTSRCKIIPDPV